MQHVGTVSVGIWPNCHVEIRLQRHGLRSDVSSTRAVQPVATCRQSPYLHKPAIVIVTSFSLWHLAPKALAAPLLCITSFSLWRHSLLSWPRPRLRTTVRTPCRVWYCCYVCNRLSQRGVAAAWSDWGGVRGLHPTLSRLRRVHLVGLRTQESRSRMKLVSKRSGWHVLKSDHTVLPAIAHNVYRRIERATPAAFTRTSMHCRRHSSIVNYHTFTNNCIVFRLIIHQRRQLARHSV